MGIQLPKCFKIIDPLGFFEFVKLELNAALIFTDSGTVQEEGCLLNRPVVVCRNETERPETITNSAVIAGRHQSTIFDSSIKLLKEKRTNWIIPDDYKILNVSDKVINFMEKNHDT